ncbi:MAG: hypothetical protein LWW86_07305 [Micrococcales bacterium]|nr:hypothetical protein [Micrococcales bacterium]
MVSVVFGMLFCVALALVVVALVAIPARRDGRALLTTEGEGVVDAARERTQRAAERTQAIAARRRQRIGSEPDPEADIEVEDTAELDTRAADTSLTAR